MGLSLSPSPTHPKRKPTKLPKSVKVQINQNITYIYFYHFKFLSFYKWSFDIFQSVVDDAIRDIKLRADRLEAVIGQRKTRIQQSVQDSMSSESEYPFSSSSVSTRGSMPFTFENMIFSYGLGKCTRNLRLVLGPCAQCCSCQALKLK